MPLPDANQPEHQTGEGIDAKRVTAGNDEEVCAAMSLAALRGERDHDHPATAAGPADRLLLPGNRVEAIIAAKQVGDGLGDDESRNSDDEAPPQKARDVSCFPTLIWYGGTGLETRARGAPWLASR